MAQQKVFVGNVLIRDVLKSNISDYIDIHLLNNYDDLNTLYGVNNAGVYLRLTSVSGIQNVPEKLPDVSYYVQVVPLSTPEIGIDGTTEQILTTTGENARMYIRRRSGTDWEDWVQVGPSIATNLQVGVSKPDGKTIIIEEDGTLTVKGIEINRLESSSGDVDLNNLVSPDYSGQFYIEPNTPNAPKEKDGLGFLVEVFDLGNGTSAQVAWGTDGSLWFRHNIDGEWTKWKGATGSGSGADTQTGSDIFEGLPSIPGNEEAGTQGPPTGVKVVEDTTTSTGQAIELDNTIPQDSVVAALVYEDMPFGLYSVIVRAKVTNSGDTSTLFTVNGYVGDTLIGQAEIKGNLFNGNDKWTSLGVGMDFSGNTGDQLKVALKRGAYEGSTKVTIDYVQLSPAPVAINAIG